MASYQYTRDIDPNELKPDAPREYTKKEKWSNWWDYHLKTVLVVGFFAVLGLWMLHDVLTNNKNPDYTVAVVTPYAVPTGITDALAQALTGLADDRNRDGEVLLTVYNCTLSVSGSEEQMDGANPVYASDGLTTSENTVGATLLMSDFQANDSYIFLLYDPAGLARYTQSFAYLDGSVPEEIDSEDTEALYSIDWYNMVYRWTDCPALTGLALGEYNDAVAGTTLDVNDYLSDLYLARRVVISEDSVKAFAGADALWNTLTDGASSTAGMGTHWKAEAPQ